MNPTFQFQCPHGHLLEGEPEQAGQQCHCPVCGILFIIPAPIHHSSATPPQFGPPGSGGAGPQPGIGPYVTPAGSSEPRFTPGWEPNVSSGSTPAFPNIHSSQPSEASDSSPGSEAATSQSGSHQQGAFPAFHAGGSAAAEEKEPEFVHIPCPNGHELETPLDMIGQEVLCPECNAQFKLRRKDSVEYKRQKEFEQEQRDRRIGNLWFNWAIVFAVAVVLGLILMMIASSG